MPTFDFTAFEEDFYQDWENQFKIGSGVGEFSFQKQGSVDSYGTTDMLISRFIINQLNLSDDEKNAWAAVINRFQDRETGWYQKLYTLHFKEHTTAYSIAALHLIGRKPAAPLQWKNVIISSRKSMVRWLNQRGRGIWSEIWSGSHVISGVPASLAMTDEGTDEFFQWYFDWLDKEIDPTSGFWRRGWAHKLFFHKPMMHDMAGAFHMYYVYEWFKRKWLHPERIIDFTLQFQHENGLWDKEVPYCVDLDGLYTLARSGRNANGYRSDEIKKSFERFLSTTERVFNNRELFFTYYANSHRLTGALAAIAECQKWYPNMVKTRRPWRQSLDFACYI